MLRLLLLMFLCPILLCASSEYTLKEEVYLSPFHNIHEVKILNQEAILVDFPLDKYDFFINEIEFEADQNFQFGFSLARHNVGVDENFIFFVCPIGVTKISNLNLRVPCSDKLVIRCFNSGPIALNGKFILKGNLKERL